MINNFYYLFPGQGAQYPGMALDFYEAGKSLSDPGIAELFELASEITGKDMVNLLENSSPQELKRTDISQPAITLANLAAAKYIDIVYLREKGLKVSGAAGFSLGEYAALTIAGIINEKDCFFLVKERGIAMQNVIDGIEKSGNEAPSMAAILGLNPTEVENLIAKWTNDGLKDLYAANYNSPKQVAISGSASALKEAETLFMENGARRVIRLQVGAPFHSPLLKEAADEFSASLERVNFNDPLIPVFSNVTGKQIMSGEEAKSLALRQIVESVRWTDVETSIAANNIDFVLETGPGKVLQGLWKDLMPVLEGGKDIPCHNAGTKEDIDVFFGGLNETGK